MPHTTMSDTLLPVEREMRAAVEGQRALAAYLATRTEVQRIQIFDDENRVHQVELPTSALRLLVDHLFDLEPAAVVAAARRQREALKHPSMLPERYLEILQRLGMVQTCKALDACRTII
ncbi:hypothetical protein [Burkholderia seminalis]|uniref:hypothetical protein n=1 Tax=Burkholderia seminalis TaxID=488731 RepID=UPI001F361A2C|nr:hypothetical protein [Burkholderia seminalis]